MKKPGVIFDLDGTLLDSLEDVANFANEVLGAYGFGLRGKEEYRYLAGEGAKNLMAKAARIDDGTLIAKMANEFKAVYEASSGASKPYDGVCETLAALEGLRVKQAVLSNKPHELTKACVDRFFGEYKFEAVFGQRDGYSVKPDTQSALEIAAIFELKPKEIVFVGDTKTDMLTAKNGGFYAIGVTWGFRDREELLAYGADALVDSPSQLLGFFGQ